MRCFIAIDLDEEIKGDLIDLQEQIKQTVDRDLGKLQLP